MRARPTGRADEYDAGANGVTRDAVRERASYRAPAAMAVKKATAEATAEVEAETKVEAKVEVEVEAEEETLEALSERVKDADDESLVAELLAMEKRAFDPTNTLLNRAQFDELLDLQTDSEPDFMQEIVDMYCDDSQSMLEELQEILMDEKKRTPEGYETARAALHKLRGASSTLGAEGIQNTCETIREAIVSGDVDAMLKGPGSLESLESRLVELKMFLKKYICVSQECAVRKLARK